MVQLQRTCLLLTDPAQKELITHPHHPNLLLFPYSPSLEETSSFIFSPYIIEPLIFAGHMLTQNKDYISQHPLQPSVAM